MSEPIKMPIPGPSFEEGRTDGRQVPDRPYVKPAPTTMPGDLEPRERAPIPTARVHGTRAHRWPLAVLALLGVAALFVQVDRALDEAAVARAEAHRAYAHTAVLRIELETVRAAIPKPGAVDEVCRQRTDGLRGAIRALVRTGNASIVGDPGWDWIDWPTATSSPTTQATEARR